MNNDVTILHVTEEGVKEIKTDEDFEALETKWEQEQRATRAEIISNLKTQDNQGTAHPMYCVCEKPNSDLAPFKPESLIRAIFFTRKEAEQYIEEYKISQDGELFIYIKSGYRNEGWKLARELMRGDTSDE